MERRKRKKKIRRILENFGILVMVLASTELMLQLLINVLFVNKNNILIVYSKETNKTEYTEIEVESNAKKDQETYAEIESQTQLEENNLAVEVETKNENHNPEANTTESKEDDVDPDDLYWLSHVIMAEEEGASYENKIMCGLVVMNRVKDEDFPNTIKDVIFQKDKKGEAQYACILNVKNKKARIWLEPNEDSIKAAKEILSGNSIKIPENVVYQSERPLGSGVYTKIENQYYCFK